MTSGILVLLMMALPDQMYDFQAGVKTAKMKEKIFGVLIDHGDSAISGPALRLEDPEFRLKDADVFMRAMYLSAVRRIFVGTDMHCTGTFVSSGTTAVFLTAAHCLFVEKSDGTYSPELYPSLMIENHGTFSPANEAVISKDFGDCMRGGLSYSDCVSAGTKDIAIVRISAIPSVVWPLCSETGVTADLTAFGYGLNQGEEVTELLSGALTVAAPKPSGYWESVSSGGQQISFGDSGGPVTSSADDKSMHLNAPSVCFIGVARNGAKSLIQPAWVVPALLAP